MYKIHSKKAFKIISHGSVEINALLRPCLKIFSPNTYIRYISPLRWEIYFRVFLSLSKNSLEDSGEISVKVTIWSLSEWAIRCKREREKNTWKQEVRLPVCRKPPANLKPRKGNVKTGQTSDFHRHCKRLILNSCSPPPSSRIGLGYFLNVPLKLDLPKLWWFLQWGKNTGEVHVDSTTRFWF